MIRTGLDACQKQQEVDRYLAAHQEIRRLFVFSFKRFPLVLLLPDSIAVECIEYADIIEYEYFYRLLEVIDAQTLLVFNECLRTQNRSDLTYNCAHHYANQTPHVLVFEYFPFIEQVNDFMILLDYQTPGKYKGRSFDVAFLHDEDVTCVPRSLAIEQIVCNTAQKDVARYERRKEQLFDTLGQGDPDTIPRQLHLFAGTLKKPHIEKHRQYVARNARLGLPNVQTYKDITGTLEECILLDFPHRRIDLNDFLKVSGLSIVRCLTTDLKVDGYYIGEFRQWNERLGEFYAQASLYQ